jgi:spermidine synthase
VLIPWLGIQRTLFAAVVANVVLGGMFLAVRRAVPAVRRSVTAALPIVLTAAAILWMPAWDASRLSIGPFIVARSLSATDSPPPGELEELAHAGTVLFHKEGLTSTVTVKRNPEGVLNLVVSGKTDASTSADDMPTQKLLAHVPLLLHPAPRRALVIGLASGITLGSAGLYPLTSLDCVEISPEMVEACRLFDPYNYRILDDPRVRVLIADGRNHLALTDRTYDVIVSEPSNPWIAGVADLFTREFFQLCRDRLAPGGIACVWLASYDLGEAPVRSVVNTFLSVFPDMSVWSVDEDYLLIGLTAPAKADHQAIADRMRKKAVADDLRLIDVRSLPDLLAYRILGHDGVRKLARGGFIHTDDNAYLEFNAPRTMIRNRGRAEFSRTMAEYHDADLSFLTGSDAKALEAVKLATAPLLRARQHAAKGTALLAQGRTDAARTEIHKAIELNPAEPLVNQLIDRQLALAKALTRRGLFAPAQKHCGDLLQLHPRHVGAHLLLGQLLLRQQKDDEALEHLTQAADYAGDVADHHLLAATTATRLGKTRIAVKHYRRAIELGANPPEALNNLAWLLVSDPALAGGAAAEAVSLAERACQLTGQRDPVTLDTLGAAYAGANRFRDALTVTEKALQLARQAGNQDLAKKLQQRIERYGKGQPYRQEK